MKEKIKCLIVLLSNSFCNYSWNDIEKEPIKLNKRAKRYNFVIKLFPFIKFEWFWNKNIQELKTLGFNRFDRLFNEVDDNSKFIITKLLYFSGRLNNETSEIILEFANNY